MKFLSILLPLAAITSSVLASGEWQSCLSSAQAQSIVDRSIIFLSHEDVPLANQTARGLFDPNIQEFGDSINSLRGDPVSDPQHCHFAQADFFTAGNSSREWY